jgi:hypothetical protein
VERLMMLAVFGSVAAVAVPLAMLLAWWSVRGLLALVWRHSAERVENRRDGAKARPEWFEAGTAGGLKNGSYGMPHVSEM